MAQQSSGGSITVVPNGQTDVSGPTSISTYYPGSPAWKITRSNAGVWAVTFNGVSIATFTDTTYVPTVFGMAGTSSMGFTLDSLTIYGTS